MSTKNPIKMIRNPNSPEAIQARLNNQPDPTIPDRIQLITDNTVGRIMIDLTSSDVTQRVGYIIAGGAPLTRKLIKSMVARDPRTGQMTMTNYYIDTKNRQWIIIKDFIATTQSQTDDLLDSNFYPKGTYAPTITANVGIGAPGENWRNQGRSVDKLREKQRQIHKLTKIDPNSNQDIHHPEDDQYREDDFDGIS